MITTVVAWVALVLALAACGFAIVAWHIVARLNSWMTLLNDEPREGPEEEERPKWVGGVKPEYVIGKPGGAR